MTDGGDSIPGSVAPQPPPTGAGGKGATPATAGVGVAMSALLGDGGRTFHSLYDGLPLGVVVVDTLAQRVILANSSFTSLLGYSEAQVCDVGVAGITYPDDLPQCVRLLEDIVTERRLEVVHEKRFVRRDGVAIPAQVSMAALPVPGEGRRYVLATIWDLSERRQVEARLRDQERFIRRVAETTPQVLYVYDIRHGVTRYVNSRLFELLGLRDVLEQRQRGEVLATLLHPEDAARMPGLIKRWDHARDDEVIETEYRLRHADGSWRWFRGRDVVFERDADGRVTQIIGTADDVTDSRRALEALRRSERRFRSYFEMPGVGTAITGPDMRWIEVNGRLCEMLGYTREELLSKRWPDLTLAEDLPPSLDLFHRVLRGELDSFSFEKRYRRRDGSELPVLVNCSVVRDDAGKAMYFVKMVEDLADRHAVQRELRSERERVDLLMAVANDAMWEWEPQTGRIWWNEAYDKRYGPRPRDLPVSLDWWRERLHEEDGPRVAQSLQDRFADGSDAWVCDYRFRLPDGSWAYILDRARIVRDKDGRVTRLIGSMVDLTDLKRADERRQRLEAELRQSQKLEAIGTLASGVAHDFNNLIMAVMGYAESARAELPTGHPAHAGLDMIRKVADQAAGLTRSLLAFTHKSPARMAPTDLVQAVRDGVALLRRLLPDAVVLRTCLPDHPVWVMADATQVQQVILNLGANARDAMPEGGDLTVAVSRGDGDATIEVVDTGVGMTPEVQARVFEPFFTTKPRGVGTGLGLWLIHGVVKEHKGRVQVASTPGKGSRFTVTLPLTDAPSLPATPAPTPQVNPGVRVLLVDDNDFVRAVIASSLRKAGYRVHEAIDGQEAMARFDHLRDELDAVVIDQDLPRRGGVTCLQAMRALKPELGVVLITGEVSDERHLPGDTGLLQKPFNVSELLETLFMQLKSVRSTQGDRSGAAKTRSIPGGVG